MCDLGTLKLGALESLALPGEYFHCFENRFQSLNCQVMSLLFTGCFIRMTDICFLEVVRF